MFVNNFNKTEVYSGSSRLELYKFEIEKRIEEIKNLKMSPSLKEGISVIIPTYKGQDVILRCLESLNNQQLSKELFEAIIIVNGEKDDTQNLIERYADEQKLENIRLIILQSSGASLARNIGISEASRKYTVFLDDDDTISPGFLSSLYALAEENTVVISQIIDINDNGEHFKDNVINNDIMEAYEADNSSLHLLSRVLTINACKLIPTIFIKELLYDKKLTSGEDVVYYTELFVRNDFKIKVAPIENEAVYYRHLRDNSVSRREMTFDFYVLDRLLVIKKLDDLLRLTFDEEKLTFIKTKINAQATFMRAYIVAHKDQKTRVIETVEAEELTYFPYSMLKNVKIAETLVISFCFPPYVDTSGIVMAKRIASKGEIVDAIYNKMDDIRSKDPLLAQLTSGLIESQFEIPSYSSFANWQVIDAFCKLGMEKLTHNYKRIYSRVMFPGSHFLALEYKLKYPEVFWSAEFSDPCLIDVFGNIRNVAMNDPVYIQRMNDLLMKKRVPILDNDNLFFLVEYLPYVFADEIVFTNENQYRFMLDTFPVHEVRHLIERKAKVNKQPTLQKEWYYLTNSDYELDSDKVNLAYFGAFYGTRKLDILFEAIALMDKNLREKLSFHIFTNEHEKIKEDLDELLSGHILLNSYVSFFEFLNLTTKFDCLVVNDTQTVEHKAINPYLPSKLSDYIGSESSIFGLIEKGSVLSEYDLPYKAEINDINEIIATLERIVDEHSSRNCIDY